MVYGPTTTPRPPSRVFRAMLTTDGGSAARGNRARDDAGSGHGGQRRCEQAHVGRPYTEQERLHACTQTPRSRAADGTPA